MGSGSLLSKQNNNQHCYICDCPNCINEKYKADINTTLELLITSVFISKFEGKLLIYTLEHMYMFQTGLVTVVVTD